MSIKFCHLLTLPKLEEKEYLEKIKKSAEIQAMQQQVMAEAEASMQQEQQESQESN